MRVVVNKSPVDQFTLIHVSAGALARRMGLSLPATVFLGFLWDFGVEPGIKAAFPKLMPYPSQDTPTHALIDAMVPSIGWLAADWFLKRSGR